MITISNVSLNFTHGVTRHPGTACTGFVGVFDVTWMSQLSSACWHLRLKPVERSDAEPATRVAACAREITLVPQFRHLSPAALLLYTVLHVEIIAHLGFSSCSFYWNTCSADAAACLSACYWMDDTVPSSPPQDWPQDCSCSPYILRVPQHPQSWNPKTE